jgi:hypothetical protein
MLNTGLLVRVMVINATFNNNSVMSWWSVLLVTCTRQIKYITLPGSGQNEKEQQRTVAPKEQLLGVAIGRPMKRKPFTSCRFLLAILRIIG